MYSLHNMSVWKYAFSSFSDDWRIDSYQNEQWFRVNKWTVINKLNFLHWDCYDAKDGAAVQSAQLFISTSTKWFESAGFISTFCIWFHKYSFERMLFPYAWIHNNSTTVGKLFIIRPQKATPDKNSKRKTKQNKTNKKSIQRKSRTN